MASIFLSHSSPDREVAARVSRQLKQQGYDSLFLDFDPDSGIKAGQNWERELYRNLRFAQAVVVLCSEHSMGARWRFAEIVHAKALGKAIFPIKIAPCEIETILTDRQVIDLGSIGEDEAYRRLFAGLRAAGLDPADSFEWDRTRPPFPGLNYFDAQDAGIYFGRDDEVHRVIETLTRMQRQEQPRLLVVVGSSGSGKSSLIRAGVLPRLAKDRPGWCVIGPFRPGTEPLASMARSMSAAFPEGSSRPDWKAIRDRLGEESCAATAGADPVAPKASVLAECAHDLRLALGRREAAVLVVVDQTEELLEHAAGDQASAFLSTLRRATGRLSDMVFGLLSLRSDSLGIFQDHSAMRGVAFADLTLGLLPVERFPQVIEGPADRAGIALEAGLVSSMIADAATDDALPLLAFTLREMYERCRAEERLTFKAYRDQLGGIKGAVARVVEQIRTDGAWTSEVTGALRRAFLKLVRLNDEGRFTRQPCRWADLPGLAAPVLEAFVKARLLSSDGDAVEVTHESLFRVWPELAGWLNEGREFMLWKKNLKYEMDDWIAHDRSPLHLVSGARVAEGRRWLASNANDFRGVESEFIAASIAAEDERTARDRAQQQRLRRLARSLTIGVVVASVLALLAIRTSSYAFRKRAEAEAQTKIATSRLLASLSRAERDKRLDRSLLLAVEALRVVNSAEARDSLFQALEARPRLASFLHVKRGLIRSVAFSPEGKCIAAARQLDDDDDVVLWDTATRRRIVEQPLAVNEGGVTSVAFSPDGMIIAAGCSVGVVIWDAATYKRSVRGPLGVNEGEVTSVAFSPDGKIIAAGYRAGMGPSGVVLWDAATRGRLVDRPLTVKESVRSVAFSADGKTLAAGCERGGGVMLWDLPTRKGLVATPLDVKKGHVAGVAFSPDGKLIVAGYQTIGARHIGGVVLWDALTRRPLVDEPLAVNEGYVSGVACSPDSKAVTAGYGTRSGRGMVVWDVVTRKRLADAPLVVDEGIVTNLAYSPDGKTIAAGYVVDDVGGGGGIQLWNATPSERLVGEPLAVNEGFVESVVFSPDGKTIAAGYGTYGINGKGGLVLWDRSTTQRHDKPLAEPQGPVRGVAFSADGQTIAAGVARGAVLWDALTRKCLGYEPLAEAHVEAVAFSSDGKTMATGHTVDGERQRGIVMLSDALSRRRLADQPLAVNEGGVTSVAFSPDSKTIAAGYAVEQSGSRGGGVVTWSTTTHRRLVDEPLAVNEGRVTSVAFSPDGGTIAAGYDQASGGVVLWDTRTRKRLVPQPLEVHEGRVMSVAISPDGETIAAGYALEDNGMGAVGGVVVWHAANRERLLYQPLAVKEGPVTSVAFSPDSKWMAAAYRVESKELGGVVVWNLNLESWQESARRIANRNFTLEEWRQYFPSEPYHATFRDLPVPTAATAE